MKKNIFNLAVFGLLIIAIFSQLSLKAVSAEEIIRFGLSPDEDNAAILKKYEPFLKYLEEETGYKIEPFVGADYAAVIEAYSSGHLDVAWFGPSEYVLAKDIRHADIEAFASAIQSDDSVPYRSSFIVASNSAYKNIDDLEGKTVAFTDPASTSGHIFGRYSLDKEGIDPDKFFGEVIYAGSHDAALLSVINGQADVAVVSSRKIPGFIESDVIAKDAIRTIYESEEIPADPLTYRNDLPQEVKDAFQKALTSNSEDLKKTLEGTEFKSFSSVDDADYDVVREAYKVAGIEPEL